MRQIISAFSLLLRSSPYKLAIYFFCTVIAGVFPIISAWLTKLIFDRLASGQGGTSVLLLGAALGFVGLIAAIIPLVGAHFSNDLGRDAGLRASDELFESINKFIGLLRFESPEFLNQLRLAQQAANSAPLQIVISLLGVIRVVITAVGFIAILAPISWWMTLIVILSGLPMLVSELLMSRRRINLYWKIGPTERREAFYSELLARVESAKEVRLFGLGGFFRERMSAERRAANRETRAVDVSEFGIQAGLSLITSALWVVGLIWAIGAARDGSISIGDVTLFVSAVASVQGALLGLVGDIGICHHSLLLFDQYLAVRNAKPDLPLAATPKKLGALHDKIEFRDVWFRYSEEHPWVLQGVNLTIDHGETVALVGLNGAGKSTLVSMLCRFYDPSKGSILWDGTDIRDADVDELRSRVGAVFQDYMEYDLTAYENIALGDLNHFENSDRVGTAAEKSGISQKIQSLPRGYDTLLTRMFLDETESEHSERGVILSGGQWQRMALARSFMRTDRDLMILDEPSSGLDAQAEHEIHSSLREMRDRQTSLLISHRLSTIRDADKIVVLAAGLVIESGTHRSLMLKSGEYARLFKLQASGYEMDSDEISA
ncbi:ABC transporter ATP-binding protein [Actinocorallia aurea]